MVKYIIILNLLLLSAATGQNTIWIDSVQSPPRQTVQFSVKVENSLPFVAFQFDVELPNVLTYITGSAQLTSRANGHQLAVTLLDQSTIRIVCYSLTLNPFSGNTGTILTFNAATSAKPGTFNLSFIDPILGDSSENNILTNSRSGQYLLLAPDIKLDVDSLDFGSIPLLQSSVRTITITNQGNQPLSMTDLNSTHPEIYFEDTSQIVIPASGFINRVARFQPLVKGNKSGTLRITSDDPDDTLKIVHTSAHAYAVNEVRIGSTFGRSGYETILKVRINNMEPFTAFEFTLALPSVVKFIPGSPQLTTRKVDHLISADTITGNRLRIIAFSPTNSIFSDIDGDIAELTFQVEGAGGIYPIPISNALIGDSTVSNILSASYGGTVEIASPKIHFDSSIINFGNVSIFDTALASIQISNIGSDSLKINSITGGDSTFWIESIFPLYLPPSSSTQLLFLFHNKEKGIYSKRFTLLHNDVTTNPSYIDLAATVFIPNRLHVISASGEQNTVIPISFGIANDEEFVGFQFDVALPPSIIFQTGTVQLSLRAQDHSVSASILSNGDIRILAFSLTQAAFLDDSGEVVRFNVNLPTDTGIYPVELKNIIIGNTANQNIASGFDNGTLEVKINTSVDEMTDLPSNFALTQNYPNPFNPSTIINYQLPIDNWVTLKIYNVLGVEIATLVNEDKKMGRYEAVFDGSSASGGLTSGVYYYRLIAGDYVSTKKFVLLK
ncbi:MAG: choice-of-anchor D domain-containing protein [Ignavibacteriales bacterium]|nr:choice-of-anchor D domain-containing protein [Ignavibacteriales bacterium]